MLQMTSLLFVVNLHILVGISGARHGVKLHYLLAQSADVSYIVDIHKINNLAAFCPLLATQDVDNM